MKIDIISLFSVEVMQILGESIIGRALANGLVEINFHQLRNWSKDKHHRVDDEVYGDGQGMLLKPEPIFAAVEELKNAETKVILMTPQGKLLKQSLVLELAQFSHLLILCGHYEGVDHRVITNLIDEEISIGDYILTNGALPAAVLCDAVVRLLPNVLGNVSSALNDSFSNAQMLEAPSYTRPAVFRGLSVPEILLSGDHQKIKTWQNEQSINRTKQNRPDLLDNFAK